MTEDTLRRKVISIWKAGKLGYGGVALPPFQLKRRVAPPDPALPFPRGLKFETSVAPEPAMVRFQDCRLLPDGSVVTDEHYIFQGLTFVPRPANWRIFAPFVQDARGDEVTLKLPPRTVERRVAGYQLVTGHGGNYGHFFLDVLGRLYLSTLLPAEMAGELRFICRPPSSPMQAYLLDALVGADRIVFQAHEAIRIDSCLVSALPCGPTGVLVEAMAYLQDLLRERVCPPAPSRPRRRIFISRADGKQTWRRDVVNSAELDGLLDEFGFERLVLSDLAPRAQIEVFQDAECLMGVHGSGLLNLLFCGPRTKIIELHVPFPSPTPPWIARVGNLLGRPHYVLPLVKRGKQTFADIDALRSSMKLVFAP